MFDLKFYYCTHCGNIAIKAVDKAPALKCCGEDMVELVAGSVDAATEKHVPVIEQDGSVVTVTVGEVEHPMEEDHFIQFICLDTTAGYQFCKLEPGMKPQATFALADGVEAKAAYEHCNKHGLWAAQA